jgi:hypothetical protein
MSIDALRRRTSAPASGVTQKGFVAVVDPGLPTARADG